MTQTEGPATSTEFQGASRQGVVVLQCHGRSRAASFEDQLAAVEQGLVRDIAGLNVPMYHAMVRHRVTKTICVTRHLSAGDIAALGFDQAPDVQAALEEAYRAMGPDASVGVIPFGGETLVRVVRRQAVGPDLPGT